MAEKPANIGAYKNMNTAKKDMSPDFLKATEKDKQKTAAKNELSAKESAAAGAGISRVGEGVDGAAETETNASSNFINNVSGRGGSKGKGRGKGFFSKKGPITLILILTIGMGGLTLGGQAMQPFALVSNIIQNFDSASYSTTARLRTTLKAGLKGAKSGSARSKIKLSDELKASLKLSGIDAEADDDGNLKSLSYESKDGKRVLVDGDNVDNMLKDAEFSGKIAKSGEMVENDSFFTSTAKNWAAKRIGWVKNRWDEFDSGGKSKTEMEAEFKDTADNPNAVKVESETEQRYLSEDVDEEGKKIEVVTEKVVDPDTGKVTYVDPATGKEYGSGIELGTNINSKTDMDVENVKNEIDGIAKVDADGEVKSSIDFDAIKKAGASASAVACAYSTVASSVAAITIAQQVVEMINIASGYMEAVQKVQAGDGDGSSLHMYNNETNQVGENGQGFWSSISISSLFGGKTAGSTAGLANVENIVTSGSMGVLGAGVGIGGWKTCTYSKLAANAVDLVSDIIGIFSFGISEVIKTGISVVVSGTVAVAVTVMLGKLTEIALEIVKTDVIENMGQIAAGDYTVGGGQYILKQMGRSTGLSAGTVDATESFAKYSETVIAARADYDRDNLSPFDITNRNTFLGSIAYSLTQFAVLNSGNMMNRTLSSVGSVLSNAATSFMPMASATVYSNIASEIANEDTCPLISSIDATGTANLCFDYTISDTRTFETTYEQAKEYLCNNGQLNCDDYENPTIEEDSEMAKYIELWTKRDTHLGLPDAAATSHLMETGNTAADGAIGAVPIIGAIIDIVNSSVDSANEKYILGSAYVSGGKDWGKLQQNMQTFLELDSVYEELALTDTPVLATYLNNYYEENPLDTSYEAVLARISGLTKDEVNTALAYIDYLEYVSEYNPSSRYAFNNVVEITKFIKNIHKTKNNISNLLASHSYSDLRNRNFAA